ncbi:MAG: Fe-S cluster assembly protein SufB [Candidatus Aenigmarchaeota archaeon]|nr:Fe-S cluster assembly protein SufB [Candidatus Aenigmarchaeota archaeon]
MTNQELAEMKNDYKYGFHVDQEYVFKSKKGLSEDVIREMSRMKKEPSWMLDFRLKALQEFWKKPMPTWGANLGSIDFQDIYYYLKPTEGQVKDWNQLPEGIKSTFDRLGIPEAERNFLAGAGAQFDSETVYHKIREDLEQIGVIFTDMDTAVKEHPDIVKKYFGTVIPYNDNKFAALNSATWSGGSFVYVPAGVKVELPLQAYFRINAQNMGQFERTLIIVEPGSFVHYVEGCFTKGAPVITTEGIKPIEEVKEGDTVLTHTLQHKRVYHTQVRPYSGKLYNVEYFGDTSQKIEVTEEHPFLIVSRQKDEYKNTDWKPEWLEAGKLKKGDYVAIPIDRTTGIEDERKFVIKIGNGRHGFKDSELTLNTDADFFRLVGYYLAEGSIVSGHYLHFTFNEKERPYIDDVKELLERYFGKPADERKPYKNGISIVLSSTKAVMFFESQFGKGASGKKIPSWVVHESPEKQKELIKGFWRGDGSFMMQQYSWGIKRMFRMNTISKQLALDLRNILFRLDIFASINMQKRGGKRHTMYCVYVGGSYLKMFAETIQAFPSNEVAVGRQIAFQMLKQINAKSYAHITENYAFVPIKNISSKNVENIPVYNFSVEGDESYVANGVVVHNCTAPVYATDSLHAAVVEVIAKENARVRYTTIQNWSNNVYNLVTKRAFAYRNATVEWIDGNLGSKITMKYPAVYLLEEGAKADILSIAFAGKGQHQDAGAKAVHLAPNTTSTIISKSISKGGGRTTYRGLLNVAENAVNSKSHVKCDALILDDQSASDTVPYMEINNKNVNIGHEATTGKVSEDQVFYLMSRGLSEQQAMTMIVSGFIEPFVKELPLEYAIELNRLIQMEMEGSVG